MLPVSFAAIIFTLGLSVFLNTSFHSFKNYNHQLKDLSNWQETSLASAKRVSLESSDLLSDIKAQLNSCLEIYSDLKDDQQRQNFQCQTDFDSSFEDFKKSLKKNYQNQLNSTIKYGLNPGDTGHAYETFDYTLHHSNKFPTAFKSGVNLYNSALVKAQQLSKELDLNSFDDYIDFDQLSIEPGLLKDLVGSENFNIISLNPAQFNLNLSGAEPLKESKLPNAIKLSVNFQKRQSASLQDKTKASSKDKLVTHSLYSVAQLKIGTSSVVVKEVVDPPPPPPCNGACGTINCPPCPVNPVTDVDRQIINFNLFDNVSGRGILFDNTQAPSSLNRINIINTDKQRFTSIYPGANNFLQIDVGVLTGNSVKILLNNSLPTINQENLNLASITFQEAVPHGHIANIKNTQEINVDIVPRARKRYMTAQKDFRVNGRIIPKGSVLVGTLDPKSGQINPQLSDFSNIRVYDQNTGALIQIFKPDDRNKNECASRSCMDIDEFTISAFNLTLNNSRIHTSFSTSQLFPGKDAFRANELFINIQKDLEVNSVLGIYAAKFDWQKDILRDDLNAQEKTLVTETLEKYKYNHQALIEFLGIGFVRTNDNFVDKLQVKIEKTFVDFVLDKAESFKSSNLIKPQILKQKKALFLGLRKIYQDFMRSSISENKVMKSVNKLLGEDFYTIPTVPPPPKAPNHPGAAPVAPIKPVCNKPKSNACKKKKKKYRNKLAKYQSDLKKHNKRLAKYQNDFTKYQAAIKTYNEQYG